MLKKTCTFLSIPDFNGAAFNLSMLRMMLAVHLSYMDFIMSSYILSISKLLRGFYEMMLNVYTIMKNPRIN